jgi:hypothetical protein
MMEQYLFPFRFPKEQYKPLISGTRILEKDKSVSEEFPSTEGKASGRICLAGAKALSTVSYRVKDKRFSVLRHVAFPDIPIRPATSGAVFSYNFYPKIELMLDGVEICKERPLSCSYKGNLVLKSGFMSGATVIRSFYPSVRYPALIEKIEVTNDTRTKIMFTAEEKKNRLTDKSLSVRRISFMIPGGKLEVGSRLVDANGDFRSMNNVQVKKLLVPGASGICYIIHYAIRKGESLHFNAEKEIKDRIKTLQGLNEGPALQSGCKELDALFAHTLARSAECFRPGQSDTDTRKNATVLLPCLNGSVAPADPADRRLLELKDAFLSGNAEAADALYAYAKDILLGASGPYPADKYGSQPATLSSAFCNAVLEGAFGIKVISPAELAVYPAISARLTGLRYAGVDFDLDASENQTIIRIGTRQFAQEKGGIFNFTIPAWTKA